MNAEQRELYGLDKIDSHVSPFTGEKCLKRSKQWWERHPHLCEVAEKVAGNEHKTEYVVRFVIKHRKDDYTNSDRVPEDVLKAIEEKEKELKALLNDGERGVMVEGY